MMIEKAIIDHIRGLLAVCKSSRTAADDSYILTINLRENECDILFKSRPEAQLLSGCEISKSECEYGGKKEWSYKAKLTDDITASWFEEVKEDETIRNKRSYLSLYRPRNRRGRC